MSVLGPSTEAESFLQNLDEQQLVCLCADLLTLEGHTEVRIMDGPGDGGRDIHSRDRQGEGYLTQSKFHQEPSRAVSSSEVSDVVRGMVKFGYRKGCFITNARISPLAKRECLNDYPGYSIDFIDGRELIREVLGNLILKAIWYDGESISCVSYLVGMPIVARDLETDRPLLMLPRGQHTYEGSAFTVGETAVGWSLRERWVSASAVEPYRRASVRTLSEPGLTELQAAEVVLSGSISLDELADLRFAVAAEILAYLQALSPLPTQHLALRLGRPYLTPLTGESAGARVEIEQHSPFTVVRHGEYIDYELRWIHPSEKSGWFPPKRFQMSASDWVRWYNPTLDACLDLTLLSPPSEFSRGLIEEQSEYFLKWWNQSLFMRLPSKTQRFWHELKIPKPSLAAYWSDDELLCAWLHPNLGLPLRPLLIESDEEENDAEAFLVNPEEVQVEWDRVKQQLADLGAVVLTPEKARHMIALVDEDPFRVAEVVEYRSVDLLRSPDIIPSPMDPQARRVRLTVCWLLGQSISPTTEPSEDELQELLSAVEKASCGRFGVVAEVDSNTMSKGSFLLVHLVYAGAVGLRNTDELLDELESSIAATIDEIEGGLTAKLGKIKRATKKYWFHEFGIVFEEAEQ